jgi:asparagine synthase (glutamine-hydrolysing)
MSPVWNTFIEELEQLSLDPMIAELINTKVLKAAISKVKQGPRPEYSFDPEYQLLMFSLIVHRFTRKFA